MTERDLTAELLELAALRGMKPLDARAVILRSSDRAELLHEWQVKYERESSYVLGRVEERELDAMADENRARHLVARESAAHERRTQRRRMRIGRRLDVLLAEVSVAPGLATPDFVPSGPRAPESSAPPAAEGLDGFSAHLSVIKGRIEQMEAEWDSMRGLGQVRNWAMASGAEKDAEILSARWRGVHSRDVAEAMPMLGSERTITRIRNAAGLTNRGEERANAKSSAKRAV